MTDQNGMRRWWMPAAIAFVSTLLVSSGASFVFARFGREPVTQPLEFNHRKHVEENEIDCSMCHASYATETFSGFPDNDTCAACHGEAIGQSAEEKRLVAMLKAGRPLVWQPLFRQPSHVFYSHRRHVVSAGLECATCHGEIARTSSPPRSVDRMTMEECMACHLRSKVAAGCTTCHR